LSKERLRDLSAAVIKLVRGYGRTPTSATSWRLDDDCVITAMEGFMTPAETVLAEEGAAPMVREMRSAFGASIADEYVIAAEGGLRRRVVSHRSQVMCDSGICLEIFLLGAERGGPGAIAPAPASSPAAAGAPLLNAGWHSRLERS
jgi:uncharacterized protein YbcI